MSKPEKIAAFNVIGLVLSVILTVAAFYLVEKQLLAIRSLYIVVTLLGLGQLFVQVIFFLRLNARTADDRWNLFSFLFIIVITCILVGGSLWIMYNLNYNMVQNS